MRSASNAVSGRTEKGFAALVSRVAARVLARNPDRLGEDFAEAAPSIVLCADLSGFSVAGARLIRSDDRGAEELRDVVNAVFERVTDAIVAHGGSVLQFSGDAVTAAWPVDGDLAGPTFSAASAGLAIQAACRQLTMGGSELRMRVAIAHGPVWIAHFAPGDSTG